jgi:hypothetical protein
VITVLCPSRGNPALLYRSVQSLRSTATGDLQVLAAIDPDEAALYAAADAYPGTEFWIAPERYGYDRLHVYYQRLAPLAQGDWLLIWNDDATMMTLGWDAEIMALPREVFVADVRSPHYPLCCFPAVRREAVEALGKFSTDTPHVDTFWGDIGVMAGVLQRVGVYAHCESPSRGNPHSFYGPEHQQEMARCAAVLQKLVTL